jgi:hypothetical protein
LTNLQQLPDVAILFVFSSLASTQQERQVFWWKTTFTEHRKTFNSIRTDTALSHQLSFLLTLQKFHKFGFLVRTTSSAILYRMGGSENPVNIQSVGQKRVFLEIQCAMGQKKYLTPITGFSVPYSTD